MKSASFIFQALCLVCLIVSPAVAHFGMVIPSDTMIMQGASNTIHLTLSFSHPFEQIGMPLDPPHEWFVTVDGKKQDLKPTLRETRVMDHRAWTSDYTVKRPGACIFAMVPAPYFEPAEDCFIIHYTKTVTAAFGDDTGWDAELGLKTEIIPLSRPFGLYAGNVFQGIVKLDGQPVPHADVEVEYYNQDGKAQAPTDYMITQTVRADGNGVFTYAAPVAGWWGFAALSTSNETIKQDGREKEVELGAVIWVRFDNWREK